MTRRKNPETAENEARLQQAIAEYQKQQKKPPKVSLRRVAKEFNVPRQTLRDRLDGKLPRNKAHEQLMHLTNEEENELVHWITTLTPCGYAPHYRTVQELAEIIRNQRVVDVNNEDIQLVNYDEFGKDWVARFMSCHPQLESTRRKCIEAARIKDVSEEGLTKCLRIWSRSSKNTKLIPKISIIWMKVGLQLAILKLHDVLSMLQSIKSFKQNLGVRNGSLRWNAFTPMEVQFLHQSYLKARIYHVNGYLLVFIIIGDLAVIQTDGQAMSMDCNGFVKYLNQKLKKANSKLRLLICNRHDSHITVKWIAHCMKNNITFMVLPPHSPHLTQPLDVGVFGPLKTLMASEIEPLVSIAYLRLNGLLHM
jgi:hypothetical protein